MSRNKKQQCKKIGSVKIRTASKCTGTVIYWSGNRFIEKRIHMK